MITFDNYTKKYTDLWWDIIKYLYGTKNKRKVTFVASRVKVI